MNYLREENALISRLLLQKMTQDIENHIKNTILKDIPENSFIALHIKEAWRKMRSDLIVDAYFSHGKEKKKEDFLYKVFKNKNIDWREKLALIEIYLILEEIKIQGGNKSKAGRTLKLSREAIRKKIQKMKKLYNEYKGE